jgi:hypothetical protein
MFNFSVTVMKKLLKELVTFLRSFNFSSFTSKVRTCSTQCNFPVSFFKMFHVVFLITFCYNSMSHLQSLCTFHIAASHIPV